MSFINLIMNELVKNLRKKSTLIFFIFSIIAIIVSCCIVKFKDYSYMPKRGLAKIATIDLKNGISNLEEQKNKAEGKYKDMYQEIIDIKKYILEIGIDNLLTSQYKEELHITIVKEIKELYNIDSGKFIEEYDKQLNKIERLKYIFYYGTFEDYINYNKDEIKEQYNSKIIDSKTYESKIQEQENNLKYEIGKYSIEDSYWKTTLLQNNDLIDSTIKCRIDYNKKIFIEDEQVERLKEDNLINVYRIKNNIPPCYTDNQYHYNELGYMRYHYNSFSNYSSMLFIGILIIILSSSTIAEEKSKGTIKFLLITPNKRYKILLAKIVSILLILIATTLMISQISVIVGNVAFGTSTNDYLYVSGGQVKVMDTHIYETLQYLLKIPEIFIYMLFGITLSTLIRNTAISTVICTICYVVIPFAMKMLETFISLDFLRFLPFRNFEFISQVLRVNTYETLITLSTFVPSVKFSVSVLLITAILLIITMFESFNKRDI